MTAPQRKIIHVDCDAFYAAVEMRDHPEWRALPLAIGGRPETRGVVATCNYAARRFGIHSAMSSARALRLCPELTIVPPDMARYREASARILAIYHDYTALVEPLSLDEAYLDVSGQPHCRGSASLMAEAIRSRIRNEIGITASAGIAPNKFLAKVASDWNKPDGQHLIRPQDAAAFIAALQVKRFYGVGKVTAARLMALGVEDGAGLATLELSVLLREFGRFGQRLHELALGIDARPVNPERVRKSLSVEETFVRDLPDLAACRRELPALLARLSLRLSRAGAPAFRGLQLKIKFADFSQTTIEQGAEELTLAAFGQLLETGYARGLRPVRLLGVGVKLAAMEESGRQMELFETAQPGTKPGST
ncbi:DNA polymerase IV [Craterilacuibacter sp.]|uniref:DNA polymerase IV n=1 Tax=Craterilacuibacter sp. TaxID=2870909 RepID=UPI003F3F8C9A